MERKGRTEKRFTKTGRDNGSYQRVTTTKDLERETRSTGIKRRTVEVDTLNYCRVLTLRFHLESQREGCFSEGTKRSKVNRFYFFGSREELRYRSELVVCV